ncbi:LysR family transcriptional regulator [Paenibacillus sp. NPDC057934]|uniref:LysR family transcriptional regulator n=1 Tax=Paenibacillus sp. NPDC057934 TaxID=3346282 RepID=UPI0036D8CC7A
MLNLHVLRLFYTVATTGSVTRASQKLNISQPAISAQIHKFEKEHNIVLFEIQGRQLVLTPLGEQLVQPLQKLFALEEQVQLLIEDHHNHPKGKLRIAGNYLSTSILIPSWAALFKKNYPEVEVHISTTTSREALEKLMNFEADVAIYGLGDMPLPAAQGLHWTELYADEFLFVVSPEHKYANQVISLQGMMAEPFIMREAGSVARERLTQLCKEHHLPAPNIELQFTGMSGSIHAVSAGYGASFISLLVANSYITHGKLAKVNVTDVNLKNTIVMCTRQQEHTEPLVEKFVAIAMHNKGSMSSEHIL